jgi:hypothetical protein
VVQGGRWEVESVTRDVEDGRWKMEDGRWKMVGEEVRGWRWEMVGGGGVESSGRTGDRQQAAGTGEDGGEIEWDVRRLSHCACNEVAMGILPLQKIAAGRDRGRCWLEMPLAKEAHLEAAEDASEGMIFELVGMVQLSPSTVQQAQEEGREEWTNEKQQTSPQ